MYEHRRAFGKENNTSRKKETTFMDFKILHQAPEQIGNYRIHNFIS